MHEPPAKLGFAFRMLGGSASLVMTNQRFFDWLWVERLELAIPDLVLPISLTTGPELFQRRRTKVRIAQLRIDQNDINRLVAERRDALTDLGIKQLQIQCRDGYIHVIGHVQHGPHTADITGKVLLAGNGGTLRLLIDTPLIYGFFPTPAPVLMHQILHLLVRKDDPDSPVTELDDRGLCDLGIAPIDVFVRRALPPSGWRIPTCAGGELVTTSSTRGAIRLRFAADSRLEHVTPSAITLIEALAKYRQADDKLRIGNIQGALQDYQDSIAKNAKDLEFLAGRITGVASCQDLDSKVRSQALDTARKALDHLPKHPLLEHLDLLRGYQSEPSRKKQPQPRTELTLSRTVPSDSPTVTSGGPRCVSAMERFNCDPTDTIAYQTLQTRAQEIEDWPTLITLLGTRAAVVDDARQAAELSYALGLVYQDKLRDPERAAYAYEQALSFAPNHLAALESLANTAYDTNDWARAYDLFKQLNPETCLAGADMLYFRVGEIAETLGRNREAMDSFAAAVLKNPNNGRALACLARSGLRVGEVHRAMEAAQAWLGLLRPDDVAGITQAHSLLAEIHACMGNLDQAIRFYNLVLSEAPTDQDALRALIGIYSNRQQYHKATQTLEKLMSLIPSASQRAELLYEMGELYRTQLGDPNLAADAFLKAIDLAPNHVPTVRRLVDYYYHTNDDTALKEMVAHLHRLKEPLNPDIDAAKRSRAMITAALANESELTGAILETFSDQMSTRASAALMDALARNPDLPDQQWGAAARCFSELVPDLQISEVIDKVIAQGKGSRTKQELLSAVSKAQ